MPGENFIPQLGDKRRGEDPALTQPPRKKAGPPDSWKLKGHHVGRSIHMFANFTHIMVAGFQVERDLALSPDQDIDQFLLEDRRRFKIYKQILQFLPDLDEGLRKKTLDTNAVNRICISIQAGAKAVRSDDLKGLKSAVLQWITDLIKGLVPPIIPTNMNNRGWNHEATGKELCPAGIDWDDPSIKSALMQGKMFVQSDQWPIFLYQNRAYNPESPWTGLFRGRLLAFKHIFTSPSSVDDSGRSTKSSNAALHGMTQVTMASIAYVATLVRFALGSRATFSSKDTTVDSQTFFNVILTFLDHPDEREEVNELIAWWNKQVFPHYVTIYRAPTANSALAKLIEAWTKRAALQALGQNHK